MLMLGVTQTVWLITICKKGGAMAKRKVKRLNKEWYVADEYGHTDKMLVIKVNELIGIVNHQQEIIHDLETILKNNRVKRR